MTEEDFKDIFPARKEHNGIKYYYAYEMVVAGLKSKCGEEKATWLSGYDEIVDWLRDSKGRGLFVHGDAGVGKSILCRDIIPKILNKDEHDRCGVMSAYELAALGEDIFNRGYLMIDDVGVEGEYTKYGARRNMVREIIDLYERMGKVLIMTSNLTIKELEEKYGERSIERLKKMCRFVLITGDSMRLNFPSGIIPKRHRAYGIDFGSEEEAVKFKREQDELYKGYYEGRYGKNPDDSDKIHERQPVKLVDGVLHALK